MRILTPMMKTDKGKEARLQGVVLEEQLEQGEDEIYFN
jgi:hypothetical protein